MYDDLIELAWAQDPKLWDVDSDDLIEMLRRAQEMQGLAKAAVDKLATHLGERLDADVTLPDGWVCKIARKPSRTGFRKTELWAKVEEVAGRELYNRGGEVVVALDRRTVEALCDLRTGNARNWREVAGVNLDDYCTVTWTTTAKVEKP